MKTKLRKLFKRYLREIPPQQKEQAEHSLLTLPLPQTGDILSFVSIGNEISTRLLNEKLLKEQRLLLPRIEGETLIAYRVTSLDNLQQGPFNTLEPFPSIPASPAFILVPGLAFDSFYHRLGYGKGYYDRFLAAHPNTPTLGLGFTQQKINQLPIQPHDQALASCLLF